MVDPSPLDASMRRLSLALTTLEASVERRFDRDRSLTSLEDELARAGDDRSRLAGDLDLEKTRSSRLQETNHEVSRRLVAAMESIRSVLDAHGG